MVEIHLSESNYRYANEIRSSIDNVLQNNPLGTDILTSEVLEKLIVNIDLKPGVDIGINCKQYPSVTLHLDPAKYEQENQFNGWLFNIHSHHEFTHLIDRLNRGFKLGLSVEPQPNEVRIWNVYIDGRLWRRGIKVKSFEDYKQLLFGLRLQKGYNCSEAIDECEKVWNAENLTYEDIQNFAQRIGQLLTQTL